MAITERVRLIRPAIAEGMFPAELDISNRRRADEAWLRLAAGPATSVMGSTTAPVAPSWRNIEIVIRQSRSAGGGKLRIAAS